MSSVPKKLLTPEEYLARERRAEFKSEYFQGEMFAMPGASYAHTLIKDNFAGEARSLFKGGPCRVLTSDMRVKIPTTGLYAYPDVAIFCEKPQFEDDIFDTLLNPKVLVEVLSDSTEKYDRGTKFRNYRKIQSLQEVVLIAQDRPHVERFVRQPDDDWLLTEFGEIGQVFAFATIPSKIPLAEIYRGVEFPEGVDR